MKLNPQLKSSGQVVVVLIIVLVLLGVGYWWLNSTKQEMAKGGKEFANEALQKIVVQHDINYLRVASKPTGAHESSSLGAAGIHERNCADGSACRRD